MNFFPNDETKVIKRRANQLLRVQRPEKQENRDQGPDHPELPKLVVSLPEQLQKRNGFEIAAPLPPRRIGNPQIQKQKRCQ